MRIEQRNILSVVDGVIVHQVNMQGVMGGGLARQIREKWPNAYDDYRRAIPQTRLGNVIPSQINRRLWVFHLVGQFSIGSGQRQTSYGAWAKALGRLGTLLVTATPFAEDHLYWPHGIGCGLGGR